MKRLPTVDERPQLRADCKHGPRPCVWISCRNNLAEVRVDADGDLVVFGERLAADATPSTVRDFEERIASMVAASSESCVLDVADRHPDGCTLEKTAHAFSLTRERVRQIENKAKRGMIARVIAKGLR